MKRTALALALLLCVSQSAAEVEVSSFPLPDPPVFAEQRIRVAILDNREEVNLGAEGAYRLEMLESGALIRRGALLPSTRVRAETSGIRFGSLNIPLYGFTLKSHDGTIVVENRRYRESVQILKDPRGKLVVVNELGLEDYLNGVLPKEIWSRWPLEVLKSQAVVSRTYALFKALTKSQEDYMLMGNTIGQVYGGRGSESRATDEAVRLTEGEVLTYEGAIFPAYFHSTCAGATTRPEYNWDVEGHPALEGVQCPYCAASTHYRWANKIPLKDIEDALIRARRPARGITEIKPEKWDKSGRPRFIRVSHALGEFSLRANDFRLIVGPDKVKSFKDIQVAILGAEALFSGLGWGHGVGMCQWGAKSLADQGKTYRDILAYYYPGSEILRTQRKR